jgi:NADPH:quinone reductase-like Zn-dependent oxidoreductase
MRTIEFNRYGGADVLELVTESPTPTPAAHEILIQVHAASVNPVDCAIRRGYGKEFFGTASQVGSQQFPRRLGRDAAGVVSGVGSAVASFRVGDRVYVAPPRASIAEFITVDASLASPMPTNIDFIEAASLPLVAMTTWNCLVNQVGFNVSNARGKRVFIARGAGGVGSFAIQLVKAWGAYVASTTSTRNVQFVKSLGADRVVDHTMESLADLPRDFDVVLDSTFTESEKLLNLLKVNDDAGYVTITSPKMRLEDEFGAEEGGRQSAAVFQKHSVAQAALGRRYYWGFMRPDGRALREVAALVEECAIRPVVDRTFRVEDIAAAHEYSESGQARGKIVLTFR